MLKLGRLDFIMLRNFSCENYICHPVQWKPDFYSSSCKETLHNANARLWLIVPQKTGMHL